MYEKPFHKKDLSNYSFLVTGGAGFIGSNIVEYLLKYDAGKVIVADNFSTGFKRNLDLFAEHKNLSIADGDISDPEFCRGICEGVDFVMHQAALGSVPRSIDDPLNTNNSNVTGFLNMLNAAKNAGVKKFVYAASSSTYGDHPDLPKVEDKIGKPLSPYAVTKLVNELYADVFYNVYNFSSIGLRYFNVFGPKQDPKGAYAAVIPLFMDALNNGKKAKINGRGEQTRDFTFVENAVEANIKALFADVEGAEIINVACNGRTSVYELYQKLNKISGKDIEPEFGPERPGDIKDSLADITKASNLIGYNPSIDIDQGLEITWKWFIENQEFINLRK